MEESSSSNFPHFWADIETEMNINKGDIDLVKSIFSSLGYMTRQTLTEIKTRKRINELEKDFLFMRSNYEKFQELIKVFPLLKYVDHFSPGVEACLFQIIHFLNSDEKRDECILKKLYEDSKVFCNQITPTDISIDIGTTGPRCRVICPKCTRAVQLGKFQNSSTGKSTFAIYNFTRHFKKFHGETDEALVNDENSGTNFYANGTALVNNENHPPIPDKKDQTIAELKAEIDNLTKIITENEHGRAEKNKTVMDVDISAGSGVMGDINRKLKEKDDKIEQMSTELSILRGQLTKIQKKFSIYLTSYDKIDEDLVTVSGNSINFKDSTNKLVYLYFDRILQQTTNETKFFALQNHLDTFLNGGNVCILNHGVTGAGKSSTMFGTSTELGILFHSAAYILDKIKIHVSIVELDKNEQYDLTNGKIQISKGSQPCDIAIDSYDQFQSIILNSLIYRNQASTDQNVASSRSHYILKFRGEGSQHLILADLAGFECMKNKQDAEQTKFINGTLSGLNTLLFNIAKGLPTASSRATQLTKYLDPYLRRTDDIAIIYHVINLALTKGLNYVKEITTSVKTKRSHPPISQFTQAVPGLRPGKVARIT